MLAGTELESNLTMPFISYFNNAKDNIPKQLAWETLDDLISIVGQHQEIKNKVMAPAICGADFAPARRLKKYVTEVSVACLDVDDQDWNGIEKVVNKIEKHQFQCIAYTTYSHSLEQPKFRFVFPLVRPVPAKLWADRWRRFTAFFGAVNDEKTSDAGRIFFVPSCSPNPSTPPILDILCPNGDALDLSALPSATSSTSPRVPVVEGGNADTDNAPLKRDELLDYAGKLKRRSSEVAKDIGRRILRALDGKPFAEPGERDDIAFKIAAFVADKFPDRDPDSFAAHFEKSVDLMEGQEPGAPTVEKLADRFREQTQKVAERLALAAQEQEEKLQFQIERSGRVSLYTEEEMQEWGPLDNQWIVSDRAGKVFHLFHNGTYWPAVAATQLFSAAEIVLAPAAEHIQLHKETGPDGTTLVRKSVQDLMSDYGVVAKRFVVDLTAQRSRFDVPTMTFTEAPCPIRDIEPKFIPEVEGWLRALAGVPTAIDPWRPANYGIKEVGWFRKLTQWISVVTMLSRPCAALYFEADPDVGKTLFANGLARLWTTGGATLMEDAVADFNDSVTRCPLVFGDETLPDELKESGTGMLRRFVQSMDRKKHAKFEAKADMVGALRVLLAANNKDLVNVAGYGESLTAADVDGIAKRFLFLRAHRQAADYLRNLGGWPKVNPLFLDGDGIARHALWLRDRLGAQTMKSPDRFLVTGGADVLARNLAIHSGLRGHVCHVLASTFARPSLATRSNFPIVDGVLYAAPADVLDLWPRVLADSKVPTMNKVSQALEGLAAGPSKLVHGRERRPVSSLFLQAWTEENLYMPWGDIQRVLEDPTVEKGARKT